MNNHRCVLFFIFLMTLFNVELKSQTGMFSYQAVFRDSTNTLLSDKTITILLSILDNGGAVKYEERHQIKTNTQGLGTLRIGEGTILSGNLQNIDWGKGPYSLKTKLPEYTLESISPILSVPIAHYAQITDSLRGFPRGSTYKVCPVSISDIDGNSYSTLKIGKQCWMGENLKVRRYNDGTTVQTFVYGAVATYGYLYDWWSVVNPRGICPDGWHLPSIEELSQVVAYFGRNFNNMSSGFKALPGGIRIPDGTYNDPDRKFNYLGSAGAWWSSSPSTDEDSDTESGFFVLYHDGTISTISTDQANINTWIAPKDFGFSVRCLRD